MSSEILYILGRSPIIPPPCEVQVFPEEVMQSIISGKAYVLGDNIDTDQIIPAQYLSFNPAIAEERKYFGMYANSGVPEGQQGLPAGTTRFVPEGKFTSEYTVIVGGENIGCGPPRGHAPPADTEAGGDGG